MVSYSDVKCVILDIEGTITSISFVKDVLFPYVKKNLRKFILQHWQEHDIGLIITALQKQSELDIHQNVEGACRIPELPEKPTSDEIYIFCNAIIDNVLWQMSLDRKTTALKQLQGCMWASAYANKEFTGHLFEDVPSMLKKWKESKQIYVYSSGSIDAQKLLFRYSVYGNLASFIDGHFDTNIGHKWDSQSYSNILQQIGLNGRNVLFLTDVPQEAYAAKKAGMLTCLVIRTGNAPIPETVKNNFICISSLSDLCL